MNRSAGADDGVLHDRFLFRGGVTSIPWTVDSNSRVEGGALIGLAWSHFWPPVHAGLEAEAGGGPLGPSFTALAIHLGASHQSRRMRALASGQVGVRRGEFTCLALFGDGCHHTYGTPFTGARAELGIEGSYWGGGLWISLQHDHQRSSYDRWVFGGTYIQAGLQVTLGFRRSRDQPLAVRAVPAPPPVAGPPPVVAPPASPSLVALRRSCLRWTSDYWRAHDEADRVDLRARMPAACRDLIDRAARPRSSRGWPPRRRAPG